MNTKKRLLLQQELTHLQLAIEHLAYSIERCSPLIQQADWTIEELERLESLTSRFARCTDIVIQRVFRLVDEIELIGKSTVLDRLYRAEQRGWGQAQLLISMRELRNIIAHEYRHEQMSDIYHAVLSYSQQLLALMPKIIADCQCFCIN